MTGWNMPPGCSPRDIPGNRPEDQAAEAFYDWLFDLIGSKMSEEATDALAEQLWAKVGEAYGEGYKAGVNDSKMAQEFAESSINRKGKRKVRNHPGGRCT